MGTGSYKQKSVKIVDAVRINGRYFDSSAVKEKIAGIFYLSAFAGCLVALGAVFLF